MTRSILLGFAMVMATSIGCVREPGGRASFTVASRANLEASPQVEVVEHLDEERCAHLLLFLIAWGEDNNHEAIIQSALERTGGDYVTNADLEFTSIPAGLYTQCCARVVGDVVRVKRRATPVAPDPTPAPEPSPQPGAAAPSSAEVSQ